MPGKDLVVHRTDINGSGFRTLAEGSRVSFDAEAGDNGPETVNVTPLERWTDARSLAGEVSWDTHETRMTRAGPFGAAQSGSERRERIGPMTMGRVANLALLP